eukprot:GHVR01171646.1.p1 GENE.GHVR01171646.1~~GHVR01171646.1.p1  ORF type:complete len:602 (+),score=205.09 GHVR01171646.1:88-1893(+)
MYRSILGVVSVWCVINRTYGINNDTDNPLHKVVTLLEEIRNDLTTEQSEEDSVYKNLKCWCDKAKRETSQSIAATEEEIGKLESSIQSSSEMVTALEKDIADIKREIASDKRGLEEATSIRSKEAEVYHSDRKDLTQAVVVIESALTILSKHHSPGGQVDGLGEAAFTSIQSVFKKGGIGFKSLKVKNRLTHRQQVLVQQFAEAGDVSVYAGQSGEVVGVLKSLLQSFNKNLKETTEEEYGRVSDFEGLKAAKLSQISASESSQRNKLTQHSDMTEMLSQDKISLRDMRGSIIIDNNYMNDIMLKCNGSDVDLSAREKAREDELTAIQETIALLTAEESQDSFSRTFGVFLSTRPKPFIFTSINKNKKSDVMKLLRSVGSKEDDKELLSLVEKVNNIEKNNNNKNNNINDNNNNNINNNSNIDKVIKSIGEMITKLKNQKKKEKNRKEWCEREMNISAIEVDPKIRENSAVTAHVDKYKSIQASLIEKVHVLSGEIDTLKSELDNTSAIRVKERDEFNKLSKHHMDTNIVIQQANDIMQKYYNDNNISSFLKLNTHNKKINTHTHTHTNVHFVLTGFIYTHIHYTHTYTTHIYTHIFVTKC